VINPGDGSVLDGGEDQDEDGVAAAADDAVRAQRPEDGPPGAGVEGDGSVLGGHQDQDEDGGAAAAADAVRAQRIVDFEGNNDGAGGPVYRYRVNGILEKNYDTLDVAAKAAQEIIGVNYTRRLWTESFRTETTRGRVLNGTIWYQINSGRRRSSSGVTPVSQSRSAGILERPPLSCGATKNDDLKQTANDEENPPPEHADHESVQQQGPKGEKVNERRCESRGTTSFGRNRREKRNVRQLLCVGNGLG
jgi:hypothetical protein